jgi:hypothetical protein
LRGKHLQNGDAVGSENIGRQIVFKVENADEFAPVDQWQGENGARAVLNDVGISRKRIRR